MFSIGSSGMSFNAAYIPDFKCFDISVGVCFNIWFGEWGTSRNVLSDGDGDEHFNCWITSTHAK